MKQLLIFFCCITLIISCSKDVNDTLDIRNQINMNEVLELQSSFDFDIGKPIRISCDNEFIYISSTPDCQIHVYDFSGKPIRRLGKKGKAPFENDAIWLFSKDETNKNYWVHDYSKHLIKKYDLKEDTLLFTKKIIDMSDNILFINDSKLLIPHFDETKNTFLLSVYDLAKESYIKNIDLITISKAEKLRKQTNIDFVFQGNFKKNKGKAVYYCYNSGISFVINLENYSVQTLLDIRQPPIPNVYIRNSEVQLEPKLLASFSGAVDDNYFYSLTTKDISDIRRKGKMMIDIYDLNNAKYYRSFEINNLKEDDRPFEITAFGDKMIVLFESGIINIYNIKKI